MHVASVGLQCLQLASVAAVASIVAWGCCCGDERGMGLASQLNAGRRHCWTGPLGSGPCGCILLGCCGSLLQPSSDNIMTVGNKVVASCVAIHCCNQAVLTTSGYVASGGSTQTICVARGAALMGGGRAACCQHQPLMPARAAAASGAQQPTAAKLLLLLSALAFLLVRASSCVRLLHPGHHMPWVVLRGCLCCPLCVA